ncbi:MAG: M6 family metalloprotease domain-containing protein [Prevotella sp.]|nr:M6 family metalloprotease domain-containing protein [Prevotella sp.]
MKRIFLLFVCVISVISVFAQDLKPCGTSILAHRHVREGSASSRACFRETPQQSAYLGEKRGLIILVEFPDTKFQNENSYQIWSDIANLHGYADNKAPGSVSDYFNDQSYGQFRLTFDVVGPIKAQHEHAYYGKNIDWGDIGWFDQKVGELVEEACLAVSSQVCFADYDWNDDGEVEQVFLLYAGHGENDYWTTDSTVIWPHMALMEEDWGYEGGLLVQDMRINAYACSNEINRSNKLVGLGTFCHEFSHCLGLPDLYDTEQQKSVVGNYDLMDQGCYNGSGWCPVGYSSYERYVCGWLIPVEVTNPKDVIGFDRDMNVTRGLYHVVNPLIRYPDACIYSSSPDANDYYLIEYRTKESWDANIPKSGLLVWHIDYDEQAWIENTVNNDPDHRRVEYMSPADIPYDVPGDANGDGLVDAADVVEVVNAIMDKPSDRFQAEKADVNGDGIVNTADIVMIVSMFYSVF